MVDVFLQGPEVYIPYLLICAIITIIGYGAFPFIFAKTRKAPIEKKKYKRLCFGINIIAMAFFLLLDGEVSGGAYFLWTLIFINYGEKVLGRRGVMPDSRHYIAQVGTVIECKHCHYRDGSMFASCPKCGKKGLQFANLDVIQNKTQEERANESAISIEPNQAKQELIEKKEAQVVSKKEKEIKKKYCSLCGALIDAETKKCTGCGKQYLKFKVEKTYKIAICVLLATLFCFVIFVGCNYVSFNKAINNEEFAKAEQIFGRIPFADKLLATKQKYMEAGLYKEKGQYIVAYNAFKNVKDYSVPNSVIAELESTIYSKGQTAYQEGDFSTAKIHFDTIPHYGRSGDYLALVHCSGDTFSAWINADDNYLKILRLLNEGFENADEVMLNNNKLFEKFLTGRWENGRHYDPYYFEIYDEGSRYNLPHKETEGYYYLSNGIYRVGKTKETAKELFRFRIIDSDTVSVYCFKNGSTYRLYRQ